VQVFRCGLGVHEGPDRGGSRRLGVDENKKRSWLARSLDALYLTTLLGGSSSPGKTGTLLTGNIVSDQCVLGHRS